METEITLTPAELADKAGVSLFLTAPDPLPLRGDPQVVSGRGELQP